MALQVQFVDSIGSTTVRYDLSPTGGGPVSAAGALRWQVDDGTDYGWPQLRVIEGQGALSDGSRIISTSYENRAMRLELSLNSAASATQREAAVRALALELDRPVNVLRVASDGLPARWIVTYRVAAAAQVLRQSNPYGLVSLQVEGYPFALGAAQPISAASRAFAADAPANEATATAWWASLPALAGDVDPPLTVQVTTGESPATLTPGDYLIASQPQRYSDGTLAFSYTSALAAVPGAPNTAVTAGLGASNNDAGILPATAANGSWYALASVTVPRITSVPAYNRAAAGQWRLLARVRRSLTGDVWALQVGAGGSQTTAGIPPGGTAPDGARGQVTLTDAPVRFASPLDQGFGMVDLGIVQVPFQSAVAGLDGTALVVSPVQCVVYAQRISGTGTLSVDYVLAVAADTTTCYVHSAGLPVFASGTGITLDGLSDSAYVTSAVAGPAFVRGDMPPLQVDGMFPRGSVRSPTRLMVAVAGNPNTIASAANPYLNVSYYPQYLAVL